MVQLTSSWDQWIAEIKLSSINPETWLSFRRNVRFGDTDAAGVMHFYQLFRWCHESWEESLELYGIHPNCVFPSIQNPDKALPIHLPIIHCEADFFLPLHTGDHIDIDLSPRRLDASSFQVQAKFKLKGKDVAVALIRHCAIKTQTRKRCPLPEGIDRWIESSSLSSGVTTL